MENILLRDPHSRANRLRRLNLSGTVGTSGHFNNTATSLLPCVKIISHGDIVAPTSNSFLGEGRFGTCHLHTFSHYEVCVKTFKRLDINSLTHEANILSRFAHRNLPYLFGVCIGDSPSIITSYHGYKGHSVTVHNALISKKTPELEDLVDIDWRSVLIQIICALEHLHNREKVLHNDLKGDNILQLLIL